MRSVRDRRVERTQRALVQALVDLVLQKRYERITIQNLLDRADVGRSTFYSHYRGKDDLLMRSFERMLEHFDRTMDREGPTRRLAPVAELFAHIHEARRFTQALARSRVLERQYQAGIEVMSRTIERRLERLAPGPGAVPHEVRARALAGALFSLLRWWVDRDAPYPPERMDAMYHAMVGLF